VHRRHLTTGLIIAVVAAVSFGVSGPFVKPLLQAGWSPVAAVALRAFIGGILLAPVALIMLRGNLRPLWRSRWRVLGMGSVGVAGAQVFYFSAVQRIPVGTAILLEYLAPLLLVAVAWVMTRRRPAVPVLIGSVVAAGGLLDILGLLFGLGAMVCCAVYFVIAAQESDDLPPVALAASGLLVGSILLTLLGLTGLVPFTASAADVTVLGNVVPWWMPMLVIGVVATAVAYATSITASAMLGSRLASFAGLLEVAAAAAWAWLLLGEQLSALQLLGGALIVAGIIAVRFDARSESLTLDDESTTKTPPAPLKDALPGPTA
jgi:drug/metabolite transporter (DMT)-like permease